MFGLLLAERRLLPDSVVRAGIRALLRARLREIDASDCENPAERHQAFLAEACRAPIALATEDANRQHDEVPAGTGFAVYSEPTSADMSFGLSCEQIWSSGADDLLDMPAVSLVRCLRLTHYEDITPHYVETLRRWREGFLANRLRVSELGYPESLQRSWEFQFACCEGTFRERSNVPAQLAFENGAMRRGSVLGKLANIQEEAA